MGAALGFLAHAGLAQAADFSARVNDHKDRVRLVLETVDAVVPAYTVSVIDDQTVEVKFSAPARMGAFTPDRAIPEINDVRVVSKDGEPLRVWVMQGAALYQQNIQLRNRVILDFKQSAALRQAKAAPVPVPVSKAKDSVIEKSAPASAPVPVPVATAAPPTPVASEPLKQEAPFKPSPGILTLSGISKFGLAAFVDDGALWVVVDQPDFMGMPKWDGDGNAPVKKFAAGGATVFQMPLPPDDMDVRVDGGDLFWRVIVGTSGNPAAVRPLTPERRDENGVRTVVWPATHLTGLFTVPNETTGEVMRIATVDRSAIFTGPARTFSEFRTPNTLAGVVIMPRVDDLTVSTGKEKDVIVSRPQGLSTTSDLQAQSYAQADAPVSVPGGALGSHDPTPATDHAVDVHGDATPIHPQDDSALLYRMKQWALGGVTTMASNEMALLADLAGEKPDARAGGYMNIGKMFLANAQGSEALAYFQMAADSQPGLADTAEFLGVRGAAYAVNGQFDLAYQDLRVKDLDHYPDVPAWRAYTLAHLQDWAQAAATSDVRSEFISAYPKFMGDHMMLTLAEIALRAGKTVDAQTFLSHVADPLAAAKGKKKKSLDAFQTAISAHKAYLLGEVARQLGKKDEARKQWDPLIKSTDNKYRTRARLALAIMNYEDGTQTVDQTLETLEWLRFSWRGDDLEMTIGARLGELYLAKNDYVRGLSVMREAATLDPTSESGRRVTAQMSEAFRTMFQGDAAKTIDPIDAITVFEKFSELIPPGQDANTLTLGLVDRLIEVDLLDRAAKILQNLVDHKMQDDQRVRTALRLAAVHVMNNRADLSLGVLNRVEGMLANYTDLDLAARRRTEQNVLKARALFMAGRTDQAMALLDTLGNNHGALRAKGDMAWQTARWGDAADAIEQLLAISPLPANKPPTKSQAELVRNFAVAANLAGDRARLKHIRDQYEILMTQTELKDEFEVITRERQTPTLADRDTLNKMVAEVDIFGEFLDSYRKSQAPEPAPDLQKSVDPNVTAPPATVVAD